jgi:hypothetical protein
MRTLTWDAIAASFVILAVPCGAQAQLPNGHSQEPTEEDLIAIGIHLRKEGRDAEALGTFERAYAQHPSPRAAAQMALAHHALAQWREAERGLVAALDSREDPWIARNRVYLEESLTVVQAHLAWLEVDSNVAGAEVWVDGAPRGRLRGTVESRAWPERRSGGHAQCAGRVSNLSEACRRLAYVCWRRSARPGRDRRVGHPGVGSHDLER